MSDVMLLMMFFAFGFLNPCFKRFISASRKILCLLSTGFSRASSGSCSKINGSSSVPLPNEPPRVLAKHAGPN